MVNICDIGVFFVKKQSDALRKSTQRVAIHSILLLYATDHEEDSLEHTSDISSLRLYNQTMYCHYCVSPFPHRRSPLFLPCDPWSTFVTRMSFWWKAELCFAKVNTTCCHSFDSLAVCYWPCRGLSWAHFGHVISSIIQPNQTMYCHHYVSSLPDRRTLLLRCVPWITFVAWTPFYSRGRALHGENQQKVSSSSMSSSVT